VDDSTRVTACHCAPCMSGRGSRTVRAPPPLLPPLPPRVRAPTLRLTCMDWGVPFRSATPRCWRCAVACANSKPLCVLPFGIESRAYAQISGLPPSSSAARQASGSASLRACTARRLYGGGMAPLPGRLPALLDETTPQRRTLHTAAPPTPPPTPFAGSTRWRAHRKNSQGDGQRPPFVPLAANATLPPVALRDLPQSKRS